jgi:CARDB
MLRAAVVAAFVTVVLPATASAAEGSVALTVCAPDARAAEFRAQMTRMPGTARMKMRFLLERRVAGSLRFRRVSAPGFSPWTRSEADRYGFTRHVDGLEGPARYRAQVRFRWIDSDGHVIARDRAWSRACRQPDHRPNLKLTALQALGKRYFATVANTGRSASEAFTLQLIVDGVTQSLAVVGLDPGTSRQVELQGPSCTSAASALADPLDEIDERSESDNARTITC